VERDSQRLAAVTTLQALADRVAQGGLLSEAEVEAIVASHDLIAVGMMADDVRRQLHGQETTFLRVFEVHVDAVPQALPPRVSAGEVRLVGRPVSLDAARTAVEQTRRLAPDVFLNGFSLLDLSGLQPAATGTFARLKDAGLDGIAETPVDPLAESAVRAAREAGLIVQRLTVPVQPDDPVSVMEAARQLQAAVGGFRAFAPLPRTMAATSPTTGYDDVKRVALARLLVRDIPSIQVDWPLYGPKLAQVALTVGADDVDGVAAIESGALGTRRSAIEEIKGNIRAAGQQPVERTGRFEVRSS
jgi:aminodeoxyfutalosine synthase